MEMQRMLVRCGNGLGLCLAVLALVVLGYCAMLFYRLLPAGTRKDLTVDLKDLVGFGTLSVAAWALWVARGQLAAMASQTSAMAQQTRVDTLLRLAERWASEPLLSSRKEVWNLMKEVGDEANGRWPDAAEDELRARCRELFETKLGEISTSDREKLRLLFQMCDFFETVGYLAKGKYIPIADTVNLLGVGVLQVAAVFEGRIVNSRNDPKEYEWFLWLVNETRRAGVSAAPEASR